MDPETGTWLIVLAPIVVTLGWVTVLVWLDRRPMPVSRGLMRRGQYPDAMAQWLD